MSLFFGGECSDCEMPCAYIMIDGDWVSKCSCRSEEE